MSKPYPLSSVLARNTAWMAVGQAARLLLQAVCFLLIARSLGPQQYGAFVAATAAVAIVYPFVGNGSGILMIKNVARDPSSLPDLLGRALWMTVASGALLSLLIVPACRLVLPRSIPLAVVLMVVASDLLVFRLVDVVCWAFQSVEKLGWTAFLNAFSSMLRLSGIGVLVAMHRATLVSWSVAYLMTSVLSAAAALACMLEKMPLPRFSPGQRSREHREGFYFSAGLSAQTIYNDIDKAMLARLATLDVAGIYGAAYRLIDVVFIPVRALLAAAYPGFFRYGERGVGESLAYARRLLLKPVTYSCLMALSILLAAPLVPRLLGFEYSATAAALRWLALLPLLKTFHCFAADSLASSGRQGLRVLMQILVAALNVLANLWIIPAYSWRGAAWTSLGSDGLLAILLWSSVTVLRKRSTPPLCAEAIVS